jgi:hypothetical protein
MFLSTPEQVKLTIFAFQKLEMYLDESSMERVNGNYAVIFTEVV